MNVNFFNVGHRAAIQFLLVLFFLLSSAAFANGQLLINQLAQADFNAIRANYTDLNLSANVSSYYVIEIAANGLTDANLRNAITTAGTSTTPQNSLIVLRTTATQNKVTLTGGQLSINIDAAQRGSVTIVSLGTYSLTISANQQSQAFNIGADATAELAGLMITGGKINGNGGGILNSGTVTIMDSIISGNSAVTGGGILNNGVLTIMNSVISENSASTSSGGGIFNSGVLTIMNSVISGNSAVVGGGIANQNDCMVYVMSCTITRNSALLGGGIYNNFAGTLGTSNTIVAKNTLDDIYNVANGTIFGNNNLIGDGSAFTNGVNGNIVGTAADPIDPLFVDVINGDYRLTACSPAVDNGSDDFAALLTVDLDDNPRFNGTVDIGAYEYQGAVGHTYEETSYTEPTCTEDGYWTYTCTDCGDVVYEIDEDSAGHDYDWIYTDPTCGADGYWTYTCTDCDNVVIEIDEGSALCVCIPVNLRVVQRGQGAVSLQWNAVHGAAGYIVKCECPDGEIEEFYTDVARFVDTGLAPETTYAYSVRTLTSDFSMPILVTTLASTATDVPIILSTTTNEFGQTTLEWTDLGDDYVYTVYRQGQVVEQYFSGNTFTDENPPPTWATAEYAVRAYNMETGRSSGSVTTIAWNTGVRHAEFTGFEVTADGITLFWNVEENDAYYQIMRGGVILAPSLLSDGWTDENPRASNDYELVVFYYDENDRLRRTFSNTLTVQWTQP